MPPFSLGETNPLQWLVVDWCQSVQHQAHLWPFAFAELCQQLLQHIRCFHESFLRASDSDHKMVSFLGDYLQFRMASLAYAINIGLFGPKKFPFEFIFITCDALKPTTKVPGKMRWKWRRSHGRFLDFQSLQCCNCSILFGLCGSLPCSRLKAPLSNIKLRRPGKLCLADMIEEEAGAFLKKKLSQPSLRLKPQTIGFLARKKTKLASDLSLL